MVLHRRWGWVPRSRPAGGRLQTTASCAGTTAGVVSVAEKASRGGRQVRAGKANESKPLKTRREAKMMSEPRRTNNLGRGLGDTLPTAQAASGVKAARARFRLLCGTWEAATPTLPPAGYSNSVWRARGRSRAEKPSGESTVAGHAVTDCLVVAMKLRNGSGATGAGYPGLVGDQLPGRRSR
jgi:hypothetical protein